jgi:hypothetical protein
MHPTTKTRIIRCLRSSAENGTLTRTFSRFAIKLLFYKWNIKCFGVIIDELLFIVSQLRGENIIPRSEPDKISDMQYCHWVPDFITLKPGNYEGAISLSS